MPTVACAARMQGRSPGSPACNSAQFTAAVRSGSSSSGNSPRTSDSETYGSIATSKSPRRSTRAGVSAENGREMYTPSSDSNPAWEASLRALSWFPLLTNTFMPSPTAAARNFPKSSSASAEGRLLSYMSPEIISACGFFSAAASRKIRPSISSKSA